MTAAAFLKSLLPWYSAVVKIAPLAATMFVSRSGFSELGLPKVSAVYAVLTYAQRTCSFNAASAAVLPLPEMSVPASELLLKAPSAGVVADACAATPVLIFACEANAASVSWLGAL